MKSYPTCQCTICSWGKYAVYPTTVALAVQVRYIIIETKEFARMGYSTIETKEAARIGYNGFLFPHEYSGEGRGA
jgi:hypothetical protein